MKKTGDKLSGWNGKSYFRWGYIDIRPLKVVAIQHQKQCPVFFQVVIQEHDIITVQEFLDKSLVWLRIVGAESG